MWAHNLASHLVGGIVSRWWIRNVIGGVGVFVWDCIGTAGRSIRMPVVV